MFVDYKELIKSVISEEIVKPPTSYGSAVGGPFEELVYKKIKDQYPDKTFKQYEYLNNLYKNNLDKETVQAKKTLFSSPTVLFLLDRGANATVEWSPENLFKEKQNDTADVLVVDNNKFEMIDVKTLNLDKKGSSQPPNIISAYKLAETCAKMIDNNDFDSFDLNYFEVQWKTEGTHMVCKNACFAELFKSNPKDLYINWTASTQIQFHVENLDQTFTKDRDYWARCYLKRFTESAKDKTEKMIKKDVEPFIKYFKDYNLDD